MLFHLRKNVRSLGLEGFPKVLHASENFCVGHILVWFLFGRLNLELLKLNQRNCKQKNLLPKKQSKRRLQKIIHDMNLNPTLPPRPLVMRFDTGTRRMDDLPDELHGEPGVEIAFDLDLQ